MKIASIGDTIIVADNAGDWPAIVTRTLGTTGRMVRATVLNPMPEALDAVTIHDTRQDALAAFNRDFMNHGYWKG